MDTRGTACTGHAGCATQDEKVAIIQELRKEGCELKYLLPAMGLSKSTYYFEIKKSDAVAEHNKNLLNEIRDIFAQNKRRYGVR